MRQCSVDDVIDIGLLLFSLLFTLKYNIVITLLVYALLYIFIQFSAMYLFSQTKNKQILSVPSC